MRRANSLSPETKQKIREMREDGLYYTTIAKHFGVAPSTVQYICDPERYAPRLRKWYYDPKKRDKYLKKGVYAR